MYFILIQIFPVIFVLMSPLQSLFDKLQILFTSQCSVKPDFMSMFYNWIPCLVIYTVSTLSFSYFIEDVNIIYKYCVSLIVMYQCNCVLCFSASQNNCQLGLLWPLLVLWLLLFETYISFRLCVMLIIESLFCLHCESMCVVFLFKYI